MVDVSVIICAHNPHRGRLERVLLALKEQTFPKNHWELLLVDNASTIALASEWDLSWHPNARHVCEAKLGLAEARQCGIRQASADLLVFVDDDNVLAPDYLSEAFQISREWPRLGVWGGSIVPEFEIEPPGYLKEFLICFGREISSPLWANVPSCSEVTPWGAGMCLRGNAARAYCEHYRMSLVEVTGRRGRDLTSGEDVEICLVACSMGFGMGAFPTLRLVHLIPEDRLDERYIVRLFEGIMTSSHMLSHKWQGIVPSPLLSPSELLRLCKHVVLKQGIHRQMYLAGLRARLRARAMIASNYRERPRSAAARLA
jgi:glycosyltransferase involved in cell wall biosynthesis